MKVAIFGRSFQKDFTPYFKLFIKKLVENNIGIQLYKPFADFLIKHERINLPKVEYFLNPGEFNNCIDFLVSIGGDGTFLETIQFIKDTNIPIIGINSGRLGFLANIAKEEIPESFDKLIQGHYTLEDRTLLEVKTTGEQFTFNYALNEVSVQKTDSTMITIDTYLNNDFLNTYWTDGLIVSTPTGSTAYSLSVGGPVVAPDSGVFVISPIASHNLTVRPVVIPDNYHIKLYVQSRNNKFLATIDSASKEFSSKMELNIAKAPFTIKMMKINNNSFYSTLRNKLLWGMDKRN